MIKAWAAKFVRMVVATVAAGWVPMLTEIMKLTAMLRDVIMTSKKLLAGRCSGPPFSCAIRQNRENMGSIRLSEI